MIAREAKSLPGEPDYEGEGDRQTDDEVGDEHRRVRIRCPKCAWEPRAESRWWCFCGHSWNTFETAARCPACEKQWQDTACPACGEWSPHVDWYEPEPGAES